MIFLVPPPQKVIFFQKGTFIANLVGGFNPSEKYDRQIGNLPQIGVKINKCLKPPPRNHHLEDGLPGLVNG